MLLIWRIIVAAVGNGPEVGFEGTLGNLPLRSYNDVTRQLWGCRHRAAG
jgi:hypothetical protein